MEPTACGFCDRSAFSEAEVVIENELCLYANSRDPNTDPNVLPGSGLIVPLAHRATAFDLTREEWAATQDLLLKAKVAIDERLKPDGYTLIWNCYGAGGQVTDPMHAHLHVIPRFNDEPHAGLGGRWYLRQPANRRPDPVAPGDGDART
jgi:diadenosine tetraphosphate (Ap4A) HIT family hydrolase